MLQKKARVRVMAVAMSLAMAAGTIGTAQTAGAATKPSLSDNGITIKVDATKKVKINKGSYTIDDVDITNEDDVDPYVDLEWTNKWIKVEGDKVGKVTIKVKITALNAKKKKKVFNKKLKVTIKSKNPSPTTAPVTPTTAPTAAPSAAPATVTVYSEAELNQAIAAGDKKITIGDKAANSIVIKSGTYKDVDLVVNAPNAAVFNYATFKSIDIQAVKQVFTEYAKDNNITLSATNSTKLSVDVTGGSVGSIFVTGVSDYNHTIEVKNGTVETMTNSVKVRSALIVYGSAVVKSANISAGSSMDVSISDTAQVMSYVVNDDGLVYFNGNTIKYTKLDLKNANNNARVNINSYVVDCIYSNDGLNMGAVVYNRSGVPIQNVVTKGATTYTQYIDPIVVKKTTISIVVSSVAIGSNTVGFYLTSPSNLDLANSAFQFSVRSGSTTGSVLNNNKVAQVDGNRPYYKLTTNSGLSAGNYYITLSTSQNYVLATTSFSVGQTTPDFPVSYFSAGNTLGTTKLNTVDTSIYEYFVDYNATVAYPNSMNWNSFDSTRQIKIITGQYVHVRKKASGGNPASGVANYQIADNQIAGEVQRIAAASAIGSIVTEANSYGDFTITHLNTAQRWWRVDSMVDTSISKVTEYINAGAGDAEIKALPNYSTYVSLLRQYAETGDVLIVDIDFTEITDWPVQGRDAATVAKELADEIKVPLKGITGNTDIVNVTVMTWKLGTSSFDPTLGARNLFIINTCTVSGGYSQNYVIANDVKNGRGCYAENVL